MMCDAFFAPQPEPCCPAWAGEGQRRQVRRPEPGRELPRFAQRLSWNRFPQRRAPHWQHVRSRVLPVTFSFPRCVFCFGSLLAFADLGCDGLFLTDFYIFFIFFMLTFLFLLSSCLQCFFFFIFFLFFFFSLLSLLFRSVYIFDFVAAVGLLAEGMVRSACSVWSLRKTYNTSEFILRSKCIFRHPPPPLPPFFCFLFVLFLPAHLPFSPPTLNVLFVLVACTKLLGWRSRFFPTANLKICLKKKKKEKEEEEEKQTKKTRLFCFLKPDFIHDLQIPKGWMDQSLSVFHKLLVGKRKSIHTLTWMKANRKDFSC